MKYYQKQLFIEKSWTQPLPHRQSQIEIIDFDMCYHTHIGLCIFFKKNNSDIEDTR